MNWARYKLLLVSGITSVIVSAVLIFWILSNLSASTDLDQSIQRLEREQTQLTSTVPYPSEANLNALVQEQESVEEFRDKIRDVIREGQLDTEPVRRSVFGDYINNVVPDLRKAAAVSKQGGSSGVLLRDPDFGLTEFLEGSLPPQQRINQLVVEIETIKHVALVLFDSGISELITIGVAGDELQTGGRNAQRQPAFGRRTQPNTDRQGAGDDLTDLETQRKRLFDVVHLKLEFRVYEDYLWETLNAMLADPNQLVVSSIAITNGNTLLWPDYLVDPLSAAERPSARERRTPTRRAGPENDLLSLLGGGQETAPTVEEESTDKHLGLKERQQNIVGDDLLNVVMELKVYRLKPEEESATQPEGI